MNNLIWHPENGSLVTVSEQCWRCARCSKIFSTNNVLLHLANSHGIEALEPAKHAPANHTPATAAAIASTNLRRLGEMFKQLQRENRKLKAKQRQSELDAKNWIRDLHGSLSELSGESSLDVMKEKVRSVKMDVEMEMGRFMLGLGHKMGHD